MKIIDLSARKETRAQIMAIKRDRPEYMKNSSITLPKNRSQENMMLKTLKRKAEDQSEEVLEVSQEEAEVVPTEARRKDTNTGIEMRSHMSEEATINDRTTDSQYREFHKVRMIDLILLSKSAN